LTAVLLGAIVAGTSPQLSALHIHRYIDHDHPEHHHGPAAHEHRATHPDGADGIHLEACDPGQHAMTVVFACAAPPQVDARDAEEMASRNPAPPLGAHPLVRRHEIRAHGPPFVRTAPPRAPPLTPTA
jgi:hypothetical protein